MKNTFHHLHRLHSHIKKHHKKYLFGIFGSFAVVKLFLLVLGLSVVQYTSTSPTFADLESGCTLTGEYYTGAYQTGDYLTGQELTGGYLIDCITLSGYWTGGSLDESGVLTGETRVEESSETGCVLTGQELTGGYLTGGYLTGGYRTGGTVTCEEELTGNSIGGNGICESGDIVWSTPISGLSVRDIFSIRWAYSGTDCLSSGLSLQLRDHNSQWINLGTLASGTTSYAFDSKRLYSFQQSGFYHIPGTGSSGQQIYLYTGTYSGTYSHLFTGYKIRLLTTGQVVLYEIPSFTIDNELPILTGISLLYSGSATGYLNIGEVVTLRFTASEELTGLQITLGSGRSPSTTAVSGLLYTYTRNLSSLYPEGILTASISFADTAGNTGAASSTGSLIFDKTRPVVTGFVFGGYTGGLRLDFSGSEGIRYTISYQRTGGNLLTGASTDYLSAQQFVFTGIERNQRYVFTLNVFDRAGNTRGITGDVLRPTSGAIISHYSFISVIDEVVLSGTLNTLASILKEEVEKFNACKSTLSYTPVELEVRRTSFIIQMPRFNKSQVKTLVNAFTLFVLNKVKNNYKITPDEITEITKKFDNFLIILKLLRDDDNTCKQNLSNYHISQFKRALEEYKISVE